MKTISQFLDQSKRPIYFVGSKSKLSSFSRQLYAAVYLRIRTVDAA